MLQCKTHTMTRWDELFLMYLGNTLSGDDLAEFNSQCSTNWAYLFLKYRCGTLEGAELAEFNRQKPNKWDYLIIKYMQGNLEGAELAEFDKQRSESETKQEIYMRITDPDIFIEAMREHDAVETDFAGFCRRIGREDWIGK